LKAVAGKIRLGPFFIKILKWFNYGYVKLFLNGKNKSFLIDIFGKPFYQQDTSQDAFHLNFKYFLEEANKLKGHRILELGSRNAQSRGAFTGFEKYVGIDIHEGESVDVVGDCHQLSKYFERGYFDIVFSISVFEHLAMPWKVILELNKVMRTGGLLFIATHSTWPPHERPWDFWRFSKDAFKVLLNPYTGFEILKNDEGLPCRILPFGNDYSMAGMHKYPANLGVSVVARKCGPHDKALVWDLELNKVLQSMYPLNPGARNIKK